MVRKTEKHAQFQSATDPEIGRRTRLPVLVGVSIALFILTRAYMLFYFHPLISDVEMYFGYAHRAVDLHQTPYEGQFEVPYPPLMLWTACAPRIFNDRPLTNPLDSKQFTYIYFDYFTGFRGLMFLFDLTSFVVFLLIVMKRCPRSAGWAALLYTVATTVLSHVLLDRLDIGLLMLLLLAVYAWTRSLDENRWSIYWSTLAYAIAGIGISYKIIPIICVPFFLLSDLHAPKRWARLVLALVVLAAGICVPLIIQYAATGPGVLGIFKFHAERVIHLESLYSTLMMIGASFGADTFVSHSHGAFDLSGDWSPAMIMLSKILLVGFLLGMGIWSLVRWSRFTRREAYLLACYTVPASVILSNVLSPQYFVWAFPMLLLLAVEIFPGSRIKLWILGALLVAVGMMTIWVFPLNFISTPINPHALVPMAIVDPSDPNAIKCLDPDATKVYVMLGLRNFTYLGVVVWMGVMLFKHLYRGRVSYSSNIPESDVK